MERPKTYKESFERVCEEYARHKTYSTLQIKGLLFLVFILMVIIYGLFVFIFS